MSELKINILNDFGRLLGARYIYEGPFSGEAFLKNILTSKFELAINKKSKLRIELDGVRGYPSSFVSGSFGKLSLLFGSDIVINHIDLISNNSIRIEKIINEIKNPKKKDEPN